MLPNPRQTYKANLLDYDALLPLSDNECSYCLSEREVAILLVFVDYIGWKTRYIATETEIDTNLIDLWSGNLASKLMSGCCGDEGLHRFDEDGVYQSSLDGGETWFDDPSNDPRNNATYFPPLEGEDGPDKRCEGAANAQEFLKQNLIDELASGLAYAEIYSTAVGIIAILGVTGIGVVIAVAAAAIFVAGVIVVQAAFTSEVWIDLKCILYCEIGDDASFTEVQWENVKAQILLQFTGVVRVILWNWVNALGFVGLTNSARSNMALGADCSDCDCGTACGGDWIVTVGSETEFPDENTIIYTSGVGVGGRSEVTCSNLISDGGDDTCCYVSSFTIDGASVIFFKIECDGSSGFGTPQDECVKAWGVWNNDGTPFTVTCTWAECP